jgi:hypothetical protein
MGPRPYLNPKTWTWQPTHKIQWSNSWAGLHPFKIVGLIPWVGLEPHKTTRLVLVLAPSDNSRQMLK